MQSVLERAQRIREIFCRDAELTAPVGVGRCTARDGILKREVGPPVMPDEAGESAAAGEQRRGQPEVAGLVSFSWSRIIHSHRRKNKTSGLCLPRSV